MQQQNLLIQLSKHYDFSIAAQRLCDSATRPFAKAWLVMDLSVPLAQALEGEVNSYAAPYSVLGKAYKHQSTTNQVNECEKRYASKADLELIVNGRQHFFEFHYLHQAHLTNSKYRYKLFQDVQRVQALRQALPKQNTTLILALWGAFTSEEIEQFKPVDNNQYASYALDTSILGSSRVSRLLHIQKKGNQG